MRDGEAAGTRRGTAAAGSARRRRPRCRARTRPGTGRTRTPTRYSLNNSPGSLIRSRSQQQRREGQQLEDDLVRERGVQRHAGHRVRDPGGRGRRERDPPRQRRRRPRQLGEQAADAPDRHAQRDRRREQVAGALPVAGEALDQQAPRRTPRPGRTGCCGCRRAIARPARRCAAGPGARARCRAGAKTAPPSRPPATMTQMRSSVTPRRRASSTKTTAAAATPSPTNRLWVPIGRPGRVGNTVSRWPGSRCRRRCRR